MYIISKFFRHLAKLDNRTVVYATIAMIALSSLAAYLLEPQTYGNVFNSFWYVMTTVTTVGYGDYYPHTVAGKCLGIFLYLFGIGLISILISKVVDGIFIFKRNREEGKLAYLGKGHFVVIGWGKNAELAIEEILASDPAIEVVLIDMLERTPAELERVHYVRGNPVNRNTLEQANAGEARSVFIFANEITQSGRHLQDTSFIDGKTLLVATAIENYYGHLHTVAEIRDRENIEHFRHVNVDDFIMTEETVSHMAVRSAFNPGASRIISQLLTRTVGDDLFQIAKRPEWSTYREAFQDLLQEGATLISSGEHLNINRRLDEEIPDGTGLFIICDQATYRKITAGNG